MPGFQPGPNNGVTGLVDLPSVGVRFNCLVYRWKWSEGVTLRDRSGRGDDHWGETAPVDLSGDIALTGKVRADAFPTPDSIFNETGTLTLQLHTDKTVALPIRIKGCTISDSIKDQDLWDIALAAEIISDPQWTGFGTNQANGVIPTADSNGTSKATYAGSAKTYDPQKLVSSARRTIDLWGAIDDTDTGEATLLANAIANAVPMFAGQVVRVASFQRASAYRAFITLDFGVRNTKQDIEMPGSTLSVDPQNLASGRRVTTVRTGTSATAYSATNAVGARLLKLRETNSVQLHDGGGNPTSGAHVDVAVYAHRTTKDDIEMPGTRRALDVSGIASGYSVATVRAGTAATTFASTATLGGTVLKLRETNSTQIHDGGGIANDERWADHATYAHRTPEDDVEMPGTFTVDDTSGLADHAQVTTLRTGTAVTAFASTMSGGGETLKLRDVTPRQIHDGGGTPESAKWEDVAQYGLTTREDDVEMGNSSIHGEPSNLQDGRNIATLTSSGATSSASFSGTSTAGGSVVKVIGVDSRQLHDGKWLHVARYGLRTVKDGIEQDNTFTVVDESDVASAYQKGTVRTGTVVTTFAPTTNVGGFDLKLRDTRVRQLHDGAGSTNSAWLDVGEYGHNNREDDIEHGGTVSVVDFDNAQRNTVTTLADATGSSVATIAALNFDLGKNDPANERLVVRKVHDGRCVLDLTTRGTNKVVIFDMQDAGRLPTVAYLESGTVRVFLADFFSITATSGAVMLMPAYRPGAIMRFGIESYVAGSTLPMNWNLTGTRNNATFLGLAAAKVTYRGISGRARLSTTNPGDGEGVHRITQEFEYDSRGIVDASRVIVGAWIPCTNSLSGLTRGSWVAASSVGVEIPTTTDSDYSIFL